MSGTDTQPQFWQAGNSVASHSRNQQAKSSLDHSTFSSSDLSIRTVFPILTTDSGGKPSEPFAGVFSGGPAGELTGEVAGEVTGDLAGVASDVFRDVAGCNNAGEPTEPFTDDLSGSPVSQPSRPRLLALLSKIS